MADQHQQERSLHQKCRHCCQPVTTAAADLQDHGVSSRLDSGSHTSQQTSHTVRSRAAKFIHIPGRPPSSSTYLFWHSVKSHGTPTCQLDMHDILLQGIHRWHHILLQNLHCPPRLGKSAKALPADRKTLSFNGQLLYSMPCSMLRHYCTSQQRSNEGSYQLKHHQSGNSRHSRKSALRQLQAINYVDCLKRLVFQLDGVQHTWEPSTQCCTYGRKML